PARGVFHCFTGGQTEAERIMDLGWYLSFSGMLTFAKAEGLRAVAAWAPQDRILIETDAPFLAPVPHRGRRNEPGYVTATAARLAELRGWTVEQTGRITRENFFRLFPRARSRL
ncbi:MAG: TatD family hydrolase, partial [Terriglobales bacterium]